MAWTTLCALDDLDEGIGKAVDIGGIELAVFRVSDSIFVMSNRCPHAGGNMSAGYIVDGCAVCPLHGWTFDLKSGALKDGFGEEEVLPIYPSRLIDHGGRRLIQADLPMP